MTIANLTIGARKYAVIPWKEYVNFQKWKSGKKAGGLSGEDQADINESLRRINDPKEKRIPWNQVKKRAGLS